MRATAGGKIRLAARPREAGTRRLRIDADRPLQSRGIALRAAFRFLQVRGRPLRHRHRCAANIARYSALRR
jgi:hypothetical protein